MSKKQKCLVYPIHPGTVLVDELQELRLSAAELVRQLHVPFNRMGGRHAVKLCHPGAYL